MTYSITRHLPSRPVPPIDYSTIYDPNGINFAICRRKYLTAMRHYENDLRVYRQKAKVKNDPSK